MKKELSCGKVLPGNTLFAYLLAIKRMVNSNVWNKFFCSLLQLFSDYNSVIDFNQIGFPPEWNIFLAP